MLRFSICILILGGLISVAAQEIEWAIPVPIESHSNNFLPSKAFDCSTERVFLCGPKEHPFSISHAPEDDLLFMTYNYSGQLLDSVIFEGVGTCHELIYHEDYVYIIGRYLGTMTLDADHIINSYDGSESVFLTKVSVSGEIQWVKNFNASPDPVTVDMAISNSGVIYINRQYGLQGGNQLIQLDSDGNEIESWIQNISFVTDVVFDAAGYIYLYGGDLTGDQMIFNGTIVSNPQDITRFIAKYDLDGTLIYAKTFMDVDISIGRLMPADNGEVYVAMIPGGHEIVDGFQFYQSGAWVFNTSIMRLNASGEIVWVRNIGVEEQEEIGDGAIELYHCLSARSDDGLLVGGFSRMYMDWGDGFITDYDGGSGFIWGLNPQGNTDLVLSNDGGFSATKMQLSTANESDYFAFVSLSSPLNFGGVTLPVDEEKLSALIKWNPVSVGLENADDRVQFSVFPNPAASNVRMTGLSSGAMIRIYDMRGREQVYALSNGTEVELDISELNPGQYYIQVIEEGRVSYGASILQVLR